ncbi:3-methyl-2-oxobutanoate hydroxymethyltransferase [Roseospira marina]|uniref:3-methyl-2-oxobutanoate hydroxymethyltransferase n=1 Tax=Roseospira marina TaxID=140057 RepID=A0A5M6IFY0_9PROT|nr:3-methyl-2-oxobutanoate hydroxymethyltransferase [Roseospira marina]KAA5607206.1 3-methyl-2-oxobutanoate hydroxymethyltransferase [Roseospira marina]MBB4312644.1 3-methyl-2-oxobutanoate hydroxymethyltransferase [Roseospira marina]MBB5085340.1 3-methyl-2-oxobutanoate hydroxymethyltransferase [Roseospira marina]
MSAVRPVAQSRRTVRDIQARKGGDPVVCLTAYTTPTARLLDPHVDLLLVGDSLGMVLYGMPTTVGVTLDMMIAHGQAVMRGSDRALVVVDMPFATAQESPAVAFRNAARVLAETGAPAVKIEGGREMADTVAFLVARGIPVMGHVGLRPQMVHAMGGFRAQGRDEAGAEALLEDAQAIADAGAFAIVVEGTMVDVADRVTQTVPVPTIGIGASAACDGQVLVAEDMLGLFTDFTPRFVRKYADLAGATDAAVAAYAADVRARRFPAPEHTFQRKVST